MNEDELNKAVDGIVDFEKSDDDFMTREIIALGFICVAITSFLICAMEEALK